MSALEERRQRAQEAYCDASGHGDNGWHAAEQAIETATRVRITPEIISAAYPTVAARYQTPRERLTAAFRAAGFEVEE